MHRPGTEPKNTPRRPPPPPPARATRRAEASPDLKGPLRPGELAEAAVLADLAVLIVILARLTPFSGLTTVIGAIPFAVLGLRHRRRVLVVAFLVGAVLTFLMAGFSSAAQMLIMATFGGVVGKGVKFGWSTSTTIAMTLTIGWTVVSSLTVGYLWVFSELRKLSIEAASVQWSGLKRFLDGAQLGVVADGLDRPIQWGFEHWFVAIPVFQFIVSIAVTGLIIQIGGPAVRRVDAAFGPPLTRAPENADLPVEPLPITITNAVVMRGSTAVRLPDIELRNPELVMLTGPNGAGKSSLLGALVGRFPLSSGDRVCSNSLGLGLIDGTAVIGQRPESQVVGARVNDDLSWGLATAPSPEQMAAVLGEVGLAGFENRETAGLSGGELQRLAIAAALLRSPRLLLSDESTAMLDPEARVHVLEVLRRVANRTSVVHVTHIDSELAFADRIVRVEPNRS